MKKKYLKILILFSLLVFFSKYSISNASFIGVSPTVVATSTCSVGLSCGLVGYWTFDGRDEVNGVMRDRSGNGNHANLINISSSTFYTLGKIGQGFDFDGSNDCVRNVSSTNIENYPKTISHWVLLGYSEINNRTSVGIGSHNSNLSRIDFSANARPTYQVSFAGPTLNGSVGLRDDKWHHVVAVSSSQTNHVLYVDGVVADTDTGSATSFTSNRIFTGCRNWQVSTDENFFIGKIDDVRIYNRALSSSEITQLYSSGNSAKQGSSQVVTPTSNCPVGLSCGLLGYWTFDGRDEVNGVMRDRSGNGNHGNLINISSSTFYTMGKIGQGFDFDGSNDYMRTGVIKTPSFVGSISMWVQRNNTESTNYLFDSRGTSNGGVGYAYILSGLGNVVTPSSGTVYLNGRLESASNRISTTSSWYHVVISGITLDINQDLKIATRFTGAESPWKGKIDDFRIYDRTLSASEISQLYSSGDSTKQGGSQVVTSTSNCSVGLSCGLVGYWTFDGKDEVNGVMRDRSGAGRNGNPINISTSTFYSVGILGQGLTFDGSSDDYVQGDMGTTYSTYTVSLWYTPKKPSAWLGNSVGIRLHQGSQVDATCTNRWYSTSPYPKIQISQNGCTGNVVSSTYTGETRYPYLNTIVFTPTQVDWYINGVLFNSTVPTSGTFDAMRYVKVGGTGSAGQSLDGNVDDFRFYGRALSASEIRQLYNMGK